MFIKNCILLARQRCRFIVLLAVIPPLAAETPSDADRLEKLEQAVEALQKRNAQLESEISGLKKTQNAFAAAAGSPKVKRRTVVTSDGKKYVEKLVPDLGGCRKIEIVSGDD